MIVQEAVYERARSRSSSRRPRSLRLGPGWDDETDVGPVINERRAREDPLYTEIGSDEGAKLLTGGEVAPATARRRLLLPPDVFGDVDPQMRIAQEEIFGPTTALIRVRDVRRGDPRLRTAFAVRPLVVDLHARREHARSARCATSQAGITYINAGTIGAEVHLPFGGMKDTGNGHREAGQAALDVFTEWKSIYVDYSGKLQKAQIDNA